MTAPAVTLRKLPDLKIRVRIAREVRARVWIAVKLIHLAAWILGGNCEVLMTGDR